jgi:hypothetical protein
MSYVIARFIASSGWDISDKLDVFRDALDDAKRDSLDESLETVKTCFNIIAPLDECRRHDGGG